MDSLTHPIPDEFKKDEEKWLKIFSTKSFFSILGAAAVDIAIFNIFSMLGLVFVGIGLSVLLIIATWIATGVKIPGTWHLAGAGLTLDIIAFRLIYRKLNRVIYVKNYGSNK